MEGKIIVIGGPTASGKTQLAIDIAQKLGTEIINADSRQIYKELNLAVAKPTDQELQLVKHHFVSTVSIHDHFSAGDFEKLGQETLQFLLKNYSSAVICGGTGMYIKALLEGLDELPEIDANLRKSIENSYHAHGLAHLNAQLLAIDPDAENWVKLNNPSRVKRSLELVIQTGKPLKEIYKKKTTNPNNATVEHYCIEMQRDRLYSRINKRVDKMVEDGLIEEAQSLFQYKELKALQTVGYSELFDSFEGQFSQNEAIDKIKQHTRNYAKRQITWFKNQFSSKWMSVNEIMDTIFVKQ